MDYYAGLELTIAQLIVRKAKIDTATAQLLSNDIMRTISLVQANSEELIFPNKLSNASKETGSVCSDRTAIPSPR